MSQEVTSITDTSDEFRFDAAPVGHLPPRMRLLCVAPTEPTWVSLTLQLDAEGCHEPQFRWLASPNEAVRTLRDESFDCIAVSGMEDNVDGTGRSHAVGLIQAIRAAGCDDPCVLIAKQITDAEWSLVAELDCEILVSPNGWESLALVSMIKRASSRVESQRQSHRLAVANHKRLVRERDEADHLLGQQRQIIQELEALARTVDRPRNDSSPSETTGDEATRDPEHCPLPDGVNDYYHELLRTYVIMGSGNLGGEIAKLAELLAVADLSPRQTLHLHLERVESLVRGLGNRSTRHIMARADLLALELMIHLGECYHQRGGTGHNDAA